MKCDACGVELSKKDPMPQTIEQWRYLYALAEKAI